MLALIDADICVYQVALQCAEKSLEEAQNYFDLKIGCIIRDSLSDEGRLFISGEDNFRKKIDSSYKANRTQEDPIYREALNEYAIKEHNAILCDGYEADDGLGCAQTEDTIICTIDKDLLQIPGRHYSWPIYRKDVEVRIALFRDVSYLEGLRFFFEQMLIGDKADNIMGVRGYGPIKARKALIECTTEKEMFIIVRDLYLEADCALSDPLTRFENNLDLLWIWRNLGETYNVRRDSRC